MRGNAVNRLASAITPTGQRVTNTYRYDDLRFQRVGSGGTEQFVWDGSDVLHWRNTGGTLARLFVEGGPMGLIRGIGVSGSGGNVLHQFHLDAMGGVQAVTNGVTIIPPGQPAQASVSTRYAVDAWGNTLSGSLAENPHVYLGGKGYWQDTDLGLDYVRARWLDPQTGRWLSADPEWDQPCFAYVGNRPTLETDPSGHQGETYHRSYKEYTRPEIQGDIKRVKAHAITGQEAGVVFPTSMVAARLHVQKYYRPGDPASRGWAARYLNSTWETLKQTGSIAEYRRLIFAALREQYPDMRFASAGDFQPDAPMDWAGYATPDVIKRAFNEQFGKWAGTIQHYVGEIAAEATRDFLKQLIAQMQRFPWVHHWVEQIYQFNRQSEIPLIRNLTPPTVDDIPNYVGGLLKGIGEGLAQALEGLNPVKIVEQIAQVLQWVCHPNTKVFRPLLDLFQGLLHLTFHDMDKQAFPAEKRGELMGQLLTAIIIAILAKKVAPGLNLKGDKAGRAVLAFGKKVGAAAQKAKAGVKELRPIKTLDNAVQGLKLRITEELSHQAGKLQQAFEKAQH